MTESQACFKFNLIFGGILGTVSDIQRKMATAESLSGTLFERSASVVVDKKRKKVNKGTNGKNAT